MSILLLLAAGSWAGEAEAERFRLQEELIRLAQRNAWSGVERTFAALERVGLPLTLEDHLLGAQAARTEGNGLAALERLQRGVQLEAASKDPNSLFGQARAQIADLQARFGYAHLVVFTGGRDLPELLRDEPPFSTEDQAAIAWASARLAEHRAFMGLLPAGSYHLGERAFVVRPSAVDAEMVEVQVGTAPDSGSALR